MGKESFHEIGQQGFTLFTALVAFILIVLAMLLVQSMISTERSVSDVISDISRQEEMQAIADLARADALQVFNYNVRYSIERFITKDTEPKDGKPDNEYSWSALLVRSWNELQQDFVKSNFGGTQTIGAGGRVQESTQFAGLAAGHLISLLERTPDARGYRIDLEHPEIGKMTTVLHTTFKSQAQKNEFFEVINCPDGKYKGCVGTFYVTLDLSKEAMDDVTYESFPLVKVEELQTGKVIKEAILPRGKFRLYAPIRLFKALAGARELAYSGGAGVFEGSFEQSLLSGKSKAEIEAVMKNNAELLLSSTRLKDPDDGFALRNYEVVAHTERDDKGTPNNTEDDTVKLIRYEVRLYFEDTNTKYMVSKQKDDRGTIGNVYGVRLVKTVVG